MICSVRTLGISGLRGSAVTAECFISNGPFRASTSSVCRIRR